MDSIRVHGAVLLGAPSRLEILAYIRTVSGAAIADGHLPSHYGPQERIEVTVSAGPEIRSTGLWVHPDTMPHADAPYDGRISFVCTDELKYMNHDERLFGFELLVKLAQHFGGWTREGYAGTRQWTYHEGPAGDCPVLQDEISLNATFGMGVITEGLCDVMRDAVKLDQAIAILTAYRADTAGRELARLPGSGNYKHRMRSPL